MEKFNAKFLIFAPKTLKNGCNFEIYMLKFTLLIKFGGIYNDKKFNADVIGYTI